MLTILAVYIIAGCIWAGLAALYGWSQGHVPTWGAVVKHAAIWPVELWRMFGARP